MILIFVEKITERLIYTLDFVLKDRGIKYELCNDLVQFNRYNSTKFSYSNIALNESLTVLASTVLFDEAFFDYVISKNTFHKEECLSFDKITDPLASIFFVLSRYEEYTCKQRDIHQRFEAKNSILSKYNWLEKVMCDRWAEDFIAFLESKLNYTFEKSKIPTNLVPTIDIDNTFAFKWKEGWRSYFSSLKEKLKKDPFRVRARIEYDEGKIKDPYDAYDYIETIAKQNGNLKLFWLVGEHSKFDRNISINDLRHQELIHKLSQAMEINLHPSYKSNTSPFYIKHEKELLEKITGKEITKSRQHFLKLELPYTYQNLIKLGFQSDFSMGYAEKVGFRAGTARPFRFFNLENNQNTDFWIHPFTYMDGTLNNYLKLSPTESKQKIKALFEELRQFGGDFIFIWHNETITDFGPWKNWKEVFEYSLNLQNEI